MLLGHSTRPDKVFSKRFITRRSKSETERKEWNEQNKENEKKRKYNSLVAVDFFPFLASLIKRFRFNRVALVSPLLLDRELRCRPLQFTVVVVVVPISSDTIRTTKTNSRDPSTFNIKECLLYSNVNFFYFFTHTAAMMDAWNFQLRFRFFFFFFKETGRSKNQPWRQEYLFQSLFYFLVCVCPLGNFFETADYSIGHASVRPLSLSSIPLCNDYSFSLPSSSLVFFSFFYFVACEMRVRVAHTPDITDDQVSSLWWWWWSNVIRTWLDGAQTRSDNNCLCLLLLFFPSFYSTASGLVKIRLPFLRVSHCVCAFSLVFNQFRLIFLSYLRLVVVVEEGRHLFTSQLRVYNMSEPLTVMNRHMHPQAVQG